MSEPVLVIMAAGLGSRFGGGGLKQVTPVGPCGERIIDYSLYDAWKAGFRRAVCVIKEEMLREFQEEIGRPIEPYLQLEYAFQTMEDIPAGCKAPGRSGRCGAARPTRWSTPTTSTAQRPIRKYTVFSPAATRQASWTCAWWAIRWATR